MVKGFAVPKCAEYTGGQLDDLIRFVKTRGAQGLVPIALAGNAKSVEDLEDAVDT